MADCSIVALAYQWLKLQEELAEFPLKARCQKPGQALCKVTAAGAVCDGAELAQ